MSSVTAASPRVATAAGDACGGAAGGCDGDVSVLAQVLADEVASRERTEAGLSREIAAVRQAAAVGAHALVELRGAVQAQLEALGKQVGSLQEDLQATKYELAEVVIDKENNQNALFDHVNKIRSSLDAEMAKLGQELSAHMQSRRENLQEAFEQRLDELRRAVDAQSARLQELAAPRSEPGGGEVVRHLERRLQEAHSGTMDLLKKMDKVMHDQLDNLSRVQASLEDRQAKDHGTLGDLRRDLNDCRELARKADGLEPRVSVLEDSHRNLQAAREHLEVQVKQLLEPAAEEAPAARGPSRSSLDAAAAAARPATPGSVPTPPAAVGAAAGAAARG
eukprot:CAMPEP_0170327488 /NCGR_PEP_ID=MMETSP0116_2-20130129/64635_1 /TAXON_ID=400756 /ORGANISM="Durinskia baltica, Strain CSIRO CS-38" /LENGTH=335 /DNA_ID=CAMNT_0010580573 /DNA_START=21 /DNA_END=1025 /DNA_ORIENTATION=+